LQIISEHNAGLKERVNKDYTYSTYEKYVFTHDKVRSFIETVLKRKDILLRELTVKFMMDFDHYLRVQENNQHNTAVKYCLNLKRILNVAVLQGLIIQNPFKIYRTVYKDTPQVYLDEQEVLRVEELVVTKLSHLLVKDLFLFQCCTGLSYTDMVRLKVIDISSFDSRGRRWIVKARQKTGVTSTIPLLPKAIEILEKYVHSKKSDDCIFPHYSIQKYNQYIGEVGHAAGIDKKLSSHVGRRTFGNIALAKGVSLNVISKILGHTNTLITQRIYAITTQNIITQEIEKW
jgi:integrase